MELIRNTYAVLLLLIMCMMAIISCEESFIPDSSVSEEQVVVEGFIEAGEGSLPAYVILTRSLAFFTKIDAEALNKVFISGAEVKISDGENTISLQEICLDQIPVSLQEQLLETFGIDIDSVMINFCIYLDVFDQLQREYDRSYDLEVRVGSELIKAQTTIPHLVPADSLWWEEPPGEPTDTLAQLWVKVADPPNEANFYRYQNAINNGPLISPFQSVTNDELFDGKEFEFPLNRAQSRDDEFDSNTFGLFTRGDTVHLKWTTIDEAHFQFWNTLEFAATNQGPFSSYTRASYNVEGALGVWGGYAVQYFTLIVPEN